MILAPKKFTVDCICRVTGHMAADCSYSWNRRSSILRPEASDSPLQHPSLLNTTCVIKDVRSLTKLFECVHVYELGSGAKLNRSKTEAMWLGAWMSRADEPLGLTWVRKMKVLGVVFGTVSCEEDNWEPKIKKLEKSLNLWRSRSLSLLGKALSV